MKIYTHTVLESEPSGEPLSLRLGERDLVERWYFLGVGVKSDPNWFSGEPLTPGLVESSTFSLSCSDRRNLSKEWKSAILPLPSGCGGI